MTSKAIISDEPPSFKLRRALKLLLSDSITRTLILPVVYKLNRCAAKDVEVLKSFVKGYNSYLNNNNPYYDVAEVLYYIIVYSEIWDALQIRDVQAVRISGSGDYWMSLHYCVVSKEKSKTCDELNLGNYDAHEIIYTRYQYWNKSATIPDQASVLLLSGMLDHVTAHKYAEYLLESLEGDNKELIAFDYATHGTLGSSYLDEQDESKGTCGMKLLASYVTYGGNLERMDKSCVDEMPHLTLQFRAITSTRSSAQMMHITVFTTPLHRFGHRRRV